MDYNLQEILHTISIWAIPILLAVTLHEAAHGYVAKLCGDRTAEMLGRVSLNPIKHIDLIGTIALPLGLSLMGSPFLFGYAKPVPVNFRNLRNEKWGSICVAAAGPLMNLFLALVSTGVAYIALHDPMGYGKALLEISIASIKINVILAVFNLIPLLPLDGGRILYALLPGPIAYKFGKTERYRLIIILILLFSGLLWQVIGPVIQYILYIFISLLPI
jgi:Zn-dependent protease